MGTRSLHRNVQRAFFVYDHQKHAEEADPKDAILFFYPPSVDVGEQIALVGGIIGMVNFCIDVLDHVPSLISLTTCKFALLKAGPFVLGLSSELSVPDQYVTQHLHYLWKTFCFFQGSLVAVKKRIGLDGFTLELDRIWNSYFSLCQSFCDHLSQAFGVIPYKELTLLQNDVFLQASHILQRAQHQTGVIGGVLLNKNRVLCTQLGTDITRRLLLLMPQERNFPCIEQKANFDLPAGVRLLFAFVTPEELAALGPHKQGDSHCRKGQSLLENINSSAPVTLASSVEVENTGLGRSLSAVAESVEGYEGEGESDVHHDSDQSEGVFYSLVDAGSPVSLTESGEGVREAEKEESQCETNDTDNKAYHDLSENNTSHVENRQMERNTECENSDRVVEMTIEQTVITDISEYDAFSNRTDLADGDTPLNDVSEEENADEECDDGDVGDRRNRHSVDFSAVEDGGAETAPVQHSADRKSTARDLSDSDGARSDGVRTLNDPDHDRNVSVNFSPHVAVSARERLCGNENGDTTDDNATDAVEKEQGESEKKEEMDSSHPGINSVTPSLADDCDGEKISKDAEETSHADCTTGIEESKEINGLPKDCTTGVEYEQSEEKDNGPANTGADTPEIRSSYSNTVGETQTVTSSVENENMNASSSSGVHQDDIASRISVQHTYSGIADSSTSADDDGNSHYIPPPTDCDGEDVTSKSTCQSSVNMTDVSSSPSAVQSLADPHLSTNINAGASDDVLMSVPTIVNNCSHPYPDTLMFPATREERLNSRLPEMGEGEGERKSPFTVPVDMELHLDLARSSASSVLTVSDDVMSPSKERLSFDSCLHVCESSGSGSGISAEGAAGPVCPLPLRECSTEPSSSDLTQSQDCIPLSLPLTSTSSSSTTLLSSPTSTHPQGKGLDQGEGAGGRDTEWGLGGRRKVLLYVQGHMDTLLVLLMEDVSLATRDTINFLWKSSLASLAELDFAVSDANSLRVDNGSSGNPYLFLKYDKSSQVMQGTATTPVTSLANELVSSSIILHDTFTSMADARDILCRTHTTYCYGHKSMSSETFFQVMASKSGGFPDPYDNTFSLDQFADRRLYTDYASSLL